MPLANRDDSTMHRLPDGNGIEQTTSDYNASLARTMVASLGKQSLAFLEKHLNRAKLSVGTLCSGTDNVLWALSAMCAALPKPPRLVHVAACESDVRKRRFIQQCHRPQILFTDVVPLGDSGHGCDALSGQVLPFPRCDVLIVGFSCKDFSTLNNRDRAGKARIIEDCLGTSGVTFNGLKGVLGHQQVPLVVTENVAALGHRNQPDEAQNSEYRGARVPGVGATNQDAIVQAFLDLGYKSEFLRLCPTAFGFPQTRKRLYGIHVYQHASVHASGEGDAHHHLKLLSHCVPCPPLDNFLQPSHCKEVADNLQGRLRCFVLFVFF